MVWEITLTISMESSRVALRVVVSDLSDLLETCLHVAALIRGMHEVKCKVAMDQTPAFWYILRRTIQAKWIESRCIVGHVLTAVATE